MICERCKQRFGDASVKYGLCDKCIKDSNSLILLRQEVLACEGCPLHKTATNKVFGKGYWSAPILFIGEAPGKKEDEEGFPFVGAAGRVLGMLIDYISLPADSFFITNILRCKPPGNRVPLQSEVNACFPFLERTIEYIKPKILVTLGFTATRRILERYKQDITEKSMGELRGKIMYYTDLKILPVYHPAALLYNKELWDVAKEDFGLLKKLYDGVK